MNRLRVRWQGKNYEVETFYGNGKNQRHVYHNILTKDPKQIAQILIDLYLEGYPIDKAIDIFRTVQEKPKDWLGV